MTTKEQLCSICFEQIIPKWNSMPETFPEFLPIFSEEEKRSNGELVSEACGKLKGMPKNPSGQQKEEIKKKMRALLEKENLLQIKEHISEALLGEFEESAECFAERVRTFDETLSNESVWQAMRNYLIYAIIVNLQGQKQNCRDTILGYSLLYPYTDNYLDQPHRKKVDKRVYNDLIRRTLLGEDVFPQNGYEKKTNQLLRLVLDHYASDRRKQSQAADLLLLMLEAQKNSLRQIHRFGAKALPTSEILKISAYKGGLSVFLDYLFSIDFDLPSVTEEERSFYLCFGLILQLADDLQDVEEDKKRRTWTLITACRRKSQREAVVNRLFHFTQTCMTEFSPKNPELHTFISRNCQLMLLAAVAQNRKRFSKAYLEKIEPHLPVPLRQFKTLPQTV